MGNSLVTVITKTASVKVAAVSKNSVNVSVLLKTTSLVPVKVIEAVTLTMALLRMVVVTVRSLVTVSRTVATHFSVTVQR